MPYSRYPFLHSVADQTALLSGFTSATSLRSFGNKFSADKCEERDSDDTPWDWHCLDAT